jgi:hypothetical protein
MNNYIIKVYKIIWVVIINLCDYNYFEFVYLKCTNVQNNLGFTKSIFDSIYILHPEHKPKLLNSYPSLYLSLLYKNR